MNRLGNPPIICLITPGKANAENYVSEFHALLDTVRSAVDDRLSIVQIREKRLPARLLFELAHEAVEIARGSSTLVLINERADVAAAAGANGVHLPENSLGPRAVLSAFSGLTIGKSVHSVGGAVRAAGEGADYVIFAPVFETPGKEPAVGLEQLALVCDAVPDTPVIALGGIDENNCRQAIDAGAAGIAAIRALNDPRSRRQILSALR